MEAYHHIRHTESEAYETFFKAMKTNHLSTIVSEAWKFFKIPVLVTDENYKLICAWPQERIGVDIWDTLLEKKVLPQSTILEYQNFYLGQDKKYYEPFYAAFGPAESCPRIFGEIYSAERIIGHVALFMFDCDLYEEDIPCVRIFIEALNMVMTQKRHSVHHTLENYLADLLNSRSSTELRYVAKNVLSEKVKGDYAIMVTAVGPSAADSAYKTMITSYIPATFHDTVSIIHKGYVVSLFGRMAGQTFSLKEKNFFAQVATFIDSTGLNSGISMPFSNLDEVEERYKQARLSAELGKGKLTFFEEAYPRPLFLAASEMLDYHYLTHPLPKALKKYDRENGSEYYQTLKVYSLNFHDKDKTAKELCIHRNTLHYRLNRIEELYGISLDDTDTSLGILNTYQLLNVVGG